MSEQGKPNGQAETLLISLSTTQNFGRDAARKHINFASREYAILFLWFENAQKWVLHGMTPRKSGAFFSRNLRCLTKGAVICVTKETSFRDTGPPLAQSQLFIVVFCDYGCLLFLFSSIFE
jgi:hypothetical protein